MYTVHLDSNELAISLKCYAEHINVHSVPLCGHMNVQELEPRLMAHLRQAGALPAEPSNKNDVQTQFWLSTFWSYLLSLVLVFYSSLILAYHCE